MEEETVHYAFDPVATTDSLEGSGIQEDVTVHLVYSVDEIGNEDDPNQPDGVPDQYQVTIEYVSEDNDKGTIGALTREVKTILQNGEWAAAGTITTTGSTATAQEGYFFQEWMVKNGSADAVPVEGEDETPCADGSFCHWWHDSNLHCLLYGKVLCVQRGENADLCGGDRDSDGNRGCPPWLK